MKCLLRNKRPVWYCLFDASAEAQDAEPGEPVISYTDAHVLFANVSPARGSGLDFPFGIDLKYDKVMLTDDMNCPIDENSVLFVDKAPKFDRNGYPLYDYVVKRVAKSLNCISIAIQKVEIS